MGFDATPSMSEPPAVAPGEFVQGYPDEASETASVGALWGDGSFVVDV